MTEQGQATAVCVELSEKELETLRYIADGYTVDEVSLVRKVEVSTVKTQLRSVYRKLQAASQAQAVAIAMRRGLME